MRLLHRGAAPSPLSEQTGLLKPRWNSFPSDSYPTLSDVRYGLEMQGIWAFSSMGNAASHTPKPFRSEYGEEMQGITGTLQNGHCDFPTQLLRGWAWL